MLAPVILTTILHLTWYGCYQCCNPLQVCYPIFMFFSAVVIGVDDNKHDFKPVQYFSFLEAFFSSPLFFELKQLLNFKLMVCAKQVIMTIHWAWCVAQWQNIYTMYSKYSDQSPFLDRKGKTNVTTKSNEIAQIQK